MTTHVLNSFILYRCRNLYEKRSRLKCLIVVGLLLFPSMTSAQTFDGNDCIDDCSGHQAGYDWAEENGIQNPDDCDGNSNSFIEGCQSYAEENPPPPEDEDVDQ